MPKGPKGEKRPADEGDPGGAFVVYLEGWER
jgi:hypothetical protein